jgi:hypothetical protein
MNELDVTTFALIQFISQGNYKFIWKRARKTERETELKTSIRICKLHNISEEPLIVTTRSLGFLIGNSGIMDIVRNVMIQINYMKLDFGINFIDI